MVRREKPKGNEVSARRADLERRAFVLAAVRKGFAPELEEPLRKAGAVMGRLPTDAEVYNALLPVGYWCSAWHARRACCWGVAAEEFRQLLLQMRKAGVIEGPLVLRPGRTGGANLVLWRIPPQGPDPDTDHDVIRARIRRLRPCVQSPPKLKPPKPTAEELEERCNVEFGVRWWNEERRKLHERIEAAVLAQLDRKQELSAAEVDQLADVLRLRGKRTELAESLGVMRVMGTIATDKDGSIRRPKP